MFSLVHWVDHSKTLREQGIAEVDVLLLKRKYFYNDANIDSRDPIQLNLLYQVKYYLLKQFQTKYIFKKIDKNIYIFLIIFQQAKESILNATHPVRQDDAVQFAAYQVQVQFGDHRETTHKLGFLE